MRRALVIAALAAGCRGREAAPAPAPAPAPLPPDADPEAPVVIARADDKVIALAADDAALYFTTIGGDEHQRRDTIWRAPWDGGAVKPIAHVDAIITAIAVGGDEVYAATIPRPLVETDADGDLIAIPARGAGGSARTIAHVLADRLAVGTTQVFFANRHRAGRVPRAGGAPVTLIASGWNQELAASGDDLYVNDVGALWHVHADGALEAVLAGPGCCGDVAIARDGAIYAEAEDTVFELRADGPHAIAAMPYQDRGTLAVGADAIYWRGHGVVWSAARAGGDAVMRCAAPGQVVDVGGGIALGGGGLAVAANDVLDALCGIAARGSGEDLIVRVDDHAPQAAPVDWIPMAQVEIGAGAHSVAEELFWLPRWDFLDAVGRGALHVRVVGRGDRVDEIAALVTRTAGKRAHVAVDRAATLPAEVPTTRAVLEIDARDLERFLGPPRKGR